MKASEVLARYTAGERNFQQVNLRGQSFEGQTLAGADFSEADLRGADFTGANLQGVNFTGAKCGLQQRWAIFSTIFCWLLYYVSVSLVIILGGIVEPIFDSDSARQGFGWLSLIVIVIFLIVLLCKGINAAAVTIAIVVAAAFLAAFEVRTRTAVAAAVAVPALRGTIAVGGVAAVAVAAAVVVAVTAAVVATAFSKTDEAVTVGGVGAAAAAVTVVAVGGVGRVGGVGAAAVFIICGYIGLRSMKGDPRDAWVRSFAIHFAAICGTSFRGANLTDANFSSARLKSTDMRAATLTRVRWYGAEMLDRVRPGNTYLQSDQVRQWLIGQGTDKNFDGQRLQGVNFQGADLSNASFIDANLSEANLRDADLSGAQLIQTQLDQTDLTGANLTGACIKDWGITSHTRLDKVKCKYVFMRSPTKDNPNRRRKPDNWEEDFEGNDFADFIQPIFDILNLYHN
ncbi:MAG: pentapeptide repeat-containing protein [Cyanobacteria bacterium J06621_8]